MGGARVGHIAFEEIVPWLDLAPRPFDEHLDLAAVYSHVRRFERPAVLVVAATFVVAVHPGLVVGVMRCVVVGGCGSCNHYHHGNQRGSHHGLTVPPSLHSHADEVIE
jgi:hypothetical protein